MKRIIYFSFTALIVLTLIPGCKVDQAGNPTENPVPALTEISPKSKVAHMPAFTLTATGANFVSNSIIMFNGTAKQTTYVSDSEITCRVEPGEIAAATGLSRTLGVQIPILVRNPGPGGGDSDPLEFTVNDSHTFYVAKKITGGSSPQMPAAAVDSAGNINVVCDNFSQGKFDVFFLRSSDNGASWSQAVNISSSDGYSEYPDIAVDNAGNIGVFWGDNTSGISEIYFKRSTDGGTSWSQAVNISGNSGYSDQPDAVVDDSGNIDVVWYDSTPGNSEIFFSRSTDNGASWSQAVNISNSPAISVRPDIAVAAGGNISVVWMDVISGYWQIFFSRSTDNGDTWSQPKKISYLWGNSYLPYIAVDNAGNLNVAWENDNFGNIFFSRSVDDGVTWSQAKNISANLGGSFGFALAVDGARNIDFIYANGASGNTDIYFMRSTDDGGAWSQAVNISDIPGESKFPVMAVDGAGNLNVVWIKGDYLYYTANTR
jgi:hypothetical protein